MKNKTVIAIIIIGAGLIGLSLFMQKHDASVVTTQGLHWHAMLKIEQGTSTVTIPAGIGLTGTEQPIHTHDTTGKIHMEFSGVVHKSDLELHHVFDEWGKPMSSFGTLTSMTVNGATTTADGSYVMHDGDQIVLQYK